MSVAWVESSKYKGLAQRYCFCSFIHILLPQFWTYPPHCSSKYVQVKVLAASSFAADKSCEELHIPLDKLAWKVQVLLGNVDFLKWCALSMMIV